jgi:type II secretion system protein H
MDKKRIKPNLNRSGNIRQAGVSQLVSYCRGQRGFSLVEMMIVVIIIGVLATIGIPAFSSWKDKQAVSNAASSLLAHLKQARNLAIAENRSVRITFSSTAYIFDADTTGNCGPCRNNVISYSQFSDNLSISPTTTRTFTSRGTANSGTITLTASGKSKSIVMNVIGRAYLQ